MSPKNVASKIIAERQPTTPESTPAESEAGRRPPIAKVGFGGVQANIWANQSDKGDFLSATFERRYQDNEGQWKTSHSYGANDLLALQKVADMAVDKIIELQQGRGRGA